MNAANAAMPGSGANAAPFLQRLAGLSAPQKAAAVNLGIFPDSGTGYSYASLATPQPSSALGAGDRLGGIENRFSAPAAAPASARQTPPVQLASVQRPAPASVQRTAAIFPKIWLQLASGPNLDQLASKFRRLKSANPELFQGIRPYVARSAENNRLLVGPFRGPSDAAFFSEDLEAVGVAPVRFTNSESDRIAPLPAE
jgi:hypothetical protein